jgi:hypothetical protein
MADLNGNMWELKSSTVDLSQQVNHSVVVTGKPIDSSSPQLTPGQPAEAAHSGPKYVLQVLTLRMLSPSCTR